MHNIPLGQETEYRFDYDASLLFPISRKQGRDQLAIDASLFQGLDLWNAYEISWLNPKGLPQVKVACLSIPCHSPKIVESKSLKLYFNSFNQSCFESLDEVANTIKRDLSNCVGAEVGVELTSVDQAPQFALHAAPGFCLDELDVSCDIYDTDATLLQCNDDTDGDSVHSHLLRSLCPVTGQPDWASIYIDYEGCQIDRTALLKYIVSFRNHQDFHELCVERIYCDIWQRCKPTKLVVYARYLRRGGIDISPCRSSHAINIQNLRSLRQ